MKVQNFAEVPLGQLGGDGEELIWIRLPTPCFFTEGLYHMLPQLIRQQFSH